MPGISTIAAIRFGTGLSPRLTPPADADALLASLGAPDAAAATWPAVPYAEAVGRAQAMASLLREQRRGGDVKPALAAARRAVLEDRAAGLTVSLARAALARDTFRERLQAFWAGHFSVRAKKTTDLGLVSPFVERAIRPHLAGRFGDMLVAVTTHPVMLRYLDQSRSIGPGSVAARNRPPGRGGLNENLAREVMELHTLGVGAQYTQDDVQQMAKLLTGLTVDETTGATMFRPNWAEPGAETVLGRAYGGAARASLDEVTAALHDLAVRPETADHLARKLATHFCADTPGPDLVAHIAGAWRASDGDLPAVMAALLEHPAAWSSFGAKVKLPWEFLASALRALDVPPEALAGLPRKRVQGLIDGPLAAMGQPWEKPPGPDGWPQAATDWVTAQGLAERIGWAMRAPRALGLATADPRAFVGIALGDAASPALAEAAARAESVPEGIGLVLASPDFNRR